ncbi:ATP-dependent nuclease [Paenibacillus periandrae]|uniref:ATP-dependent nuclease n=1 Tax=Paenibacillus periandrae TaxID=1761741 RepID=UPI001F08D493|nr:AAA family ATPase [Paenibacillus periandrae]
MIKIEKINIRNYRKFRNEDIYLDRTLTAIAGSNNAGKTSIVELMSSILLSSRKDSVTIDDMNYNARKEDLEKLQSISSDSSLTDDEKVEKLQAIRNTLNKITVCISIQYDENDDLKLFSDYVSEFDVLKRNYYFVVEYGYKKCKEKDILDIVEKKQDIMELFSSLESSIFYCDENAKDRISINNKEDFYKLFNYHCVYALRKLSDTSEEKQSFLSKHLLKTVRNDTKWKIGLDELIKDLNELLIEKKLSSKIDEITINTLKQTLDDFSKTNGGKTGKLGIDFKLENQDIEKVLLEFTKIYFEQDGGGKIKEQKQGLGYSNLIYLLLETQIFREKLDKEKVNLLVFEEPEAHLHPQMENVFIQYLNRMNATDQNLANAEQINDKFLTISPLETYETNSILEAAAASSGELESEDVTLFQMFITTHSSEMTKSIKLPGIRVLRPDSHVETNVYDLQQFLTNLNPDEKKFYSKFFQFNMIEMVFADKLILFEGDAERLLLKYLMSNDQRYKSLSTQYISFIQVGGAYAHNYLKLINFLKIKTLILSDIDYVCDTTDFHENINLLIKEVLGSNTTNQAIEKITGKKKVKDIIKSQIKNKGVYPGNELVCLKFQTNKDGYARTLEDAILKSLLDIRTVFCKISKEDFNLYIDQYHLQMSGPKKAETSLRDRVDKLQQKTDFMYSLIEHDQIKNSVPVYIKEGLEWLQG